MLKPIQVEDLMERLAEHAAECRLTPEEVADHLREHILLRALELEHWNGPAAAKRLGLHRNTVLAQCKKFGVKR
jgi:transcriptional regulator of acetoin/glycerol metabolism